MLGTLNFFFNKVGNIVERHEIVSQLNDETEHQAKSLFAIHLDAEKLPTLSWGCPT